MGAFLTVIFELLGLVAKNPIVQKIAMFSFFFGLLTYFVDFFVGKVNLTDYSDVLVIASYFGLLQAFTVVIKFLITAFIMKQIIAYIRN